MKNNKAFTLIELLVVVLIIGVLAAIAVPQYQKAVDRSKFTQLRLAVKAIANAEEAFYAANGRYANSFTELDISFPQGSYGKVKNDDDRIFFEWGRCSVYNSYPSCSLKDVNVDYYIRLANVTTAWKKTMCTAETASKRAMELCELEIPNNTKIPTDNGTCVYPCTVFYPR